MSRYLCVIPDGRAVEAQADCLALAEACAAVTLELGNLPRGSLLLRIGGAL